MTKLHIINDHYKTWIANNLQPNVYAVGTLMQRRRCHDGANSYLVCGNNDEYAKAYDRFIRRFSKAIYGSTNWKRHRELIPNCATLEGGSWKRTRGGGYRYEVHSTKSGVRFHINASLRRPGWVPFDEFASELKRTWAEGDWMMPDIFVQERTGDCIGYSLKEGAETLLPNSMSWPRGTGQWPSNDA